MKATLYLVQQFLNVEREEDMMFGYVWEAKRFIARTYKGGAYIVEIEITITHWRSFLATLMMKIPFITGDNFLNITIEK